MRRCQRQAHTPHAADRQADQGHAIDVQVIEQRQGLACDVIQRRCAGRQRPGLTVAPEVQGDHPILLRQRGNLRRPHGLVPQVAAGQQDCRAGALIEVVEGLAVYRYEGHRVAPPVEREQED
ncbi:hypothetical protein D3C73_1328650 [compost metagenome]